MEAKTMEKGCKIIFTLFFSLILTVILCIPTVRAVQAENEKTIILCFDDGPRLAILRELLPILSKYQASGTFFVQGWAISSNKDLIKKMHDVGYEIENHSWGHENFLKLFRNKGEAEIKKSIAKTDNAIFLTTGRKPKFFRPPFWCINKEVEKIIEAEGYTVMKLDNPDINTMDYEDVFKHRPPKILIERVKKIIALREKQNKFRHILVFHELTLTVQALDTLIPYFQNQGYQFRRLDSL